MKLIDSFMVNKAKLQVKLIIKMGGRGNKIINDGLIRTKDGSWKSVKLGYLINNEIPEECINEDEKGRPTVILRFDNGSGNIEFLKPLSKPEIIKSKLTNSSEELTPEDLEKLDKQNAWYLTPGKSILKPLDIRADDILERVDRRVYTEFFKSSPWKWLIGLAIGFIIAEGISFAFMANGILSLQSTIASIQASAHTVAGGVIPGG